MMIVEQAKEELEILESQHPNRFEYLKLELKSFISLLQNDSSQQQQQQHFLFSNHAPAAVFSSPRSISVPNPTTMTQESSTRKKRKKVTFKNQTAKERSDGNRKRRNGADAAIEKAQACLHKIQEFKTSF